MMDLPIEIWGFVFNKLPQNTVLNLRLVCQRWKKEVDNHFKNWVISLVDKAPPEMLTHILQLRIKSCKIIRCVQSLPSVNTNNPKAIFKRPELITEIWALKNLVRQDNVVNISPQNLHQILRFSSRHLKILRLDLSDSFLTKDVPLEDLLCYNFSNLEVLKIGCYFKPATSLELHENNLLSQMSQILIPNLKSLTLQFSKTDRNFTSVFSKRDQSKLSLDVLAFVASHGKGLEHLRVDMKYKDDNEFEFEDISTHNFNFGSSLQPLQMRLKQINCLKTLDLSMVNKDENSVTTAWRDFVIQQTKLRKLRLCGLAISNTEFRDVALKNFSSVTDIEIFNLRIPDVFVGEDGYDRCNFDVSFLESCYGLKKLSIRDGNYDLNLPAPYFLNLPKLPLSLSDCTFSSVVLISTELIDFIRSHKSLSSLCLKKCERGSPVADEELGVNGSVLLAIVHDSRKNLNKVRIVDFSTYAWDELKKLQWILTNPPFALPLLKTYVKVEIIINRDRIMETWTVEDFKIRDDEDEEDDWL